MLSVELRRLVESRSDVTCGGVGPQISPPPPRIVRMDQASLETLLSTWGEGHKNPSFHAGPGLPITDSLPQESSGFVLTPTVIPERKSTWISLFGQFMQTNVKTQCPKVRLGIGSYKLHADPDRPRTLWARFRERKDESSAAIDWGSGTPV